MAKKKRRKGSGGAYTEEVSSGSKPIEGVGTAVAAFVGFARRRPARTILTGLVTLAAIAVVVRSARG